MVMDGCTTKAESSSWGSNSPLSWREQNIVFWEKTMALKLTVLILILADSHSATNPSSASTGEM